MLNFAQIPILGRTGASYHPYYQAILDRASTLGYTAPSTPQKALQNALVIALVNSGVWAKLDVLYILATNGSSDFSRLNWKNPALYELTAVSSPTFTSNQGWAGNATSSYLDTNWVPSTNGVNFTLDNASFGGRVNSGSASQSWVEFGCSTASNVSSAYLFARLSGFVSFRVNATFTRQVSEASPIAFWHLDRDNSSSTSIYKNGSSLATATDNSSIVPDVSFTIGCMNNGGTKQNFSSRQVSMVWAGASMLSEASAFYTAWNTYFTSL